MDWRHSVWAAPASSVFALRGYRVVVPWPCRYSLEYGPGWTLVEMISAAKAARADVLPPGVVGSAAAHAPASPSRQAACAGEGYAARAAQSSADVGRVQVTTTV